MTRLSTFWENNKDWILFLAFVALLALYVISKVSNTKENGVVTVAKITGHEGAESGSELFIDIYLDGKVYSTSIGQGCLGQCIGKYFFIKVLKNDPTSYPFLYAEKPVPECILNHVKHFRGWNYFPTCENY